jgi:hypothetical protein
MIFKCNLCGEERNGIYLFMSHFRADHYKEYEEMLLQQDEVINEIVKLEQTYTDITIPLPLLNWNKKYTQVKKQ